MKNKSIVQKLFLSMTFIFFLFMFIVYIGQTFFLEKFYINKKTEEISEHLQSFVKSYDGKSVDEQKLKQSMNEFYEKNNAHLAILDRNGILKYENAFDITIKTEDKGEITIPLTNILNSGEYELIDNLQLQKGTKVYMEGFLYESVFVPSYIQTAYGKWQNQTLGMRNVILKGEITKTTLPIKNNITVTSQLDMLTRGIQQWVANVNKNNISLKEEVTIYEYTDSVNGVKNKIFVQPIFENKSLKEIVFVMTSLQPINEAVTVVKTFYWYAFGVALIFIIIVSFYFSKIISKPLLRMNDVTQKMAELDFSEKIIVQGKDEIGSLSESINSLSTNLRETIEQLQVANEKLQEDIEKERQLEKTRKDFISSVSHELKTPLSIMKSYTEGIKDGITKEHQDKYTDIILEEIEKMDTLVVDMLELAKFESGTYLLNKQPFSIVQLIDDVNHKLMFALQEKNVDIQLQTEDDYNVMADRVRIEQVMVNFVTNAIRYGAEDSDVIIALKEEGNLIKIEVENEGNPIPVESLEKLWDQFYRVDYSRNRDKGGTGLGLSIVQNILQLHDADFGVENTEKGVLFYFYLDETQ